MAACWYTTSLAPNERLVALALADFADDHGRCWPSLTTIGQKIGYSRRNTRRIVKTLRNIGYVDILIKAGPRRTPLYQLHPELLEYPEKEMLEPPLPMPPPEREDFVEGGPVPYAAPREDSLSPLGEDTGDPSEGTPPAVREDSGDPLSVIEPPEEPPEDSGGEDNLSPLPLERFEDDLIADGQIPRPRNLGWDALTELFGYDPEEEGEQTLWGKLAAKANEEQDPHEAVRGRALALVGQWGAKSLTAPSLLKHWQRFGTAIGSATDGDVEELQIKADRARRLRRAEATEAGTLTEDQHRQLEDPS